MMENQPIIEQPVAVQVQQIGQYEVSEIYYSL